ncbi:MAG TPA: nitrogenase cofactor biosynthesis protein NifB [Chlorobaculum sp.]|uniref:FeMo cofactor biosynthesis protein NifB n=1 Tax=Chlorobaculum tepidum (strain ATCC 49652 / DSM 12025 / NBRC 103806 / TLS) TaxID=194439 RepID=NIFB_CHLTE|nr:nitrogenase cofactor biosynthesis protein NifB [Chlorobaculum tepidum]Q8KC85.1 RecName: Full=FeMo cofactor biosynthesis protein NifB; AltName: Full=FeMo-cofactor maturase NifB; AltName: Full=Nitrogenase cofactor maturase NifB; AltName: Full=Radical SAM assemblase NifB [Chlorobaculum tepidum TLS]AAM72766.1 nifB protein [Chlorobaculum tepidum TLS]HBU22395.1 nitrogenase cofactor biosynthesis protein NifB [Chlorobaculum sp.]
MTLNIKNHPCFNDSSRHTYGRIHLPVAPKCNIQCNYCNRKFDCMNENRPGITSKVLSPRQALYYLDNALKLSPNISVVGIAGPGDPFANPEETMETLRLVREKYPEMLLCVATNGLDMLPYIEELAELQVSHVTLTINAIDPEIGQEIYAWVRYQKKMYRDRQAAELLLENQLAALQKLKRYGVTAKVNSIIIPGVNDQHVIEVARQVASMGADILNALPYYNTTETVFENIPEPDPMMVRKIQEEAGKLLPQMKHCARCRADAVGIIGEINSDEMMAKLAEAALMPKNPDEHRPYIAVASLEGVLINQHLGEADRFLVYALDEEKKSCTLVDSRQAPPPGGGKLRWEALAAKLSDCRAVLVNSAGDSPQSVLKASGIDVMSIEGVIEEAVYGVFTGQNLKHLMKSSQIHACKTSCGGDGNGCD